MPTWTDILESLNGLLAFNAAEPPLFNRGWFLWYFIFVYAGFLLVYRNTTLRTLFLTIVSAYFYYKSSGIFILLLALNAVVSYMLGFIIYGARTEGLRRTGLLAMLGFNLGFLAYYKHLPFFTDLFGTALAPTMEDGKFLLPVGISFFTFQSLSYCLDIYRGQLKPITNLLDFSFFITFFPHLVAGPIVRASEFLPQIPREFSVSRDDLGKAWFLLIGGLIKKAVISDYISINFVDRVFSEGDVGKFTGLECLMGVYGYALQIYCDFSGYSDMAIGLALLMGFRLPQNFDTPYRSSTITEFWRRWHISLSSWLRDYLYISLGGNRHGKFRQQANLLITMLLGGWWHGATWNFIAWGGIHGLALVLDKLFGPVRARLKGPVWKWLGVIFTFHLVCACWVFFRARTWDDAWMIFHQIGTQFHPEIFGQWLHANVFVVVLMVTGYVFHFIPDSVDARVRFLLGRTHPLGITALLALAAYLVIQVKTSDIQAFIYFQF